MTILKNILAGAAAAAACSAASAALAQAPGEDSAVFEQECDRACLLDMLGQYMDALRAGAPSAVPAADDLMFTENNVVIPLGEGLWGTVEKVDEVGLEVADAQTQNAAWFGSVIENGDPAIFAVRIHVRDGKIDEAESVVHRKTGLPAPFGNTENMRHDPDFNAVLAPEERRGRARMRAIADSYFDTVEVNDGQVFAPFHEDCGRLENGISTTTRAADGVETDFILVDGCEAQFKLGIYRINKRIRERLYPIIDEERGVVVATGFFDHANEWDRYLLTDGREMKTALKWPNSITLLEAFRIKDAKISRIEAVFTYVPYFMHNPFAGPAAKPPVSVSSPQTCNARCLSSLASQVMNAHPKRGAWKKLPWADEVGYEENSVGMQVGEGVWGSTTAVDNKPLIVADAELGRALWLGRIEAHGQPSWAAVTVTADGDRIGRVESVIRRKEYGPPFAEPANAPVFSAVPSGQRTSRMDMLAAVDRFYEAVNAGTGSVPGDFAEMCEWAVNGEMLSPCAEPLAKRRFQALKQVRDRKTIAVDEARGLVAVSAYEDFTAIEQAFTDADDEPYADSHPYPRTLQTVSVFRFSRGKIERIEAYASELPYGMKPR